MRGVSRASVLYPDIRRYVQVAADILCRWWGKAVPEIHMRGFFGMMYEGIWMEGGGGFSG